MDRNSDVLVRVCTKRRFLSICFSFLCIVIVSQDCHIIEHHCNYSYLSQEFKAEIYNNPISQSGSLVMFNERLQNVFVEYEEKILLGKIYELYTRYSRYTIQI